MGGGGGGAFSAHEAAMSVGCLCFSVCRQFHFVLYD